MTTTDPAATAARALSLLDLTDLSDTSDAAAVCISPRFVAEDQRVLGDAGTVRMATVMNFPSGAAESSAVTAETRAAIADGADEIDLVIPFRALVARDQETVSTMMRAMRNACTGAVLKATMETGELREPRLIEVASGLAIAAGADVLKTSTARSPPTPRSRLRGPCWTSSWPCCATRRPLRPPALTEPRGRAPATVRRRSVRHR